MEVRCRPWHQLVKVAFLMSILTELFLQFLVAACRAFLVKVDADNFQSSLFFLPRRCMFRLGSMGLATYSLLVGIPALILGGLQGHVKAT